MDPAKVIGKVKEQVRMEHKSRRNYPKVWSNVADVEKNRFYNQNEIDSQLKDKLKLQDLCPYEHDNKGECYFISSDMHHSLLGTCRCGRPRRGLHMAFKCLQRTISPVYDNPKEEAMTLEGVEMKKKPQLPVPSTSNSQIGFLGMHSSSYRKLEQSMQYVSPTYSMPGPRVTTAPYNVIIIG
ncbi:uncharacterized protein [Drosophila tropicalis]|uniref:uncharacterized protein n=1 Tax=Drosophila tropicalis TaxID=46794 RepID=UPI0035ABE135